MKDSIFAPPAIGDAIQCWPVLDNAWRNGFDVYASPPVYSWIVHYLKWTPKEVRDFASDIPQGRVIDFNGTDDVIVLLAETSALEIIGFAKADEYTTQIPFLGNCGSLYDWYREFWRRREFTLPIEFPFIKVPRRVVSGATVLIIPHSSSADKNWPIEYYVALAILLRDAGFQVKWLHPHASLGYVVPPYELPYGIEGIETHTWTDTFDLIDSVFVVVTNDGSPMHIAAAQEKRVVGIFTRSAKSIWFPYKSKRTIATGSGNFERPEGHHIPSVEEILELTKTVCSL